MKKVLITGVSGFAGSFLLEHLQTLQEFTITGTYHSDTSLQHIKSKDGVTLSRIDLMDAEAVDKFIEQSEFDFIFHLAALSSIAESFKDPISTVTTNVTVQMNLLEALRKTGKTSTRVLIVSSADIYGIVSKDDLPIDEKTDLRPVSPYGVSKVAQDFLGLQYYLTYGMPIIRARSFNHIGPKQSPYFVVSSFAKRIAEIEKNNLEPVLHVGNLEAKRDFTDVRDVVRAYHLLLEKAAPGEVFNVGSGSVYKVSDVLDRLLSFARIKINIHVDESLLRPIDIPELVCNNRKMAELTGWKPSIPLEQSLKDTLDYWRNSI